MALLSIGLPCSGSIFIFRSDMHFIILISVIHNSSGQGSISAIRSNLLYRYLLREIHCSLGSQLTISRVTTVGSPGMLRVVCSLYA